MNLHLLPLTSLVTTGPVDHADWSYRPILSTISRARLKLVLRLLPLQPVRRLLEVGYGSGIFLPELATHCRELFAIDPHESLDAVASELRAFHVNAALTSGTAEAMQYPSGYFDREVAVSSLEFIPDIEAAAGELCRVLAPGGSLVCVTPGHSRFVDFGLEVLTGESAKHDYGDRRERLADTLAEWFTVKQELLWPPLAGRAVALYQALELVPRSARTHAGGAVARAA